jgi:hypothetical protein
MQVPAFISSEPATFVRCCPEPGGVSGGEEGERKDKPASVCFGEHGRE